MGDELGEAGGRGGVEESWEFYFGPIEFEIAT